VSAGAAPNPLLADGLVSDAVLVWALDFGAPVLLPFLTVPLAMLVARAVWMHDRYDKTGADDVSRGHADGGLSAPSFRPFGVRQIRENSRR
jgi:hypothetical protein